MDLTDLERRAKHCVTHHHACDCREYGLQRQIVDLQERLAAGVEANKSLRDHIVWMEERLAAWGELGDYLRVSHLLDRIPLDKRDKLIDLGEV